MPKSRKDRVVALTKTAKKGKDLKRKNVETLRECVDTYRNIFVFSTENMRNTKMKDVRAHWSTSRFFLGKNKVMQLALGREAAEEYKENLSKLSKKITGKRGLFFTNSSKEEVLKYFSDFSEPNYARSGFAATEDFTIPEGELPPMPVSMEPVLRKLGLPVRLQDGKLMLPVACSVCKKGDTLTPEQCKLLELFEHPMAIFRVKLHCMWSGNTFEDLLPEDDEHENAAEEDDSANDMEDQETQDS